MKIRLKVIKLISVLLLFNLIILPNNVVYTKAASRQIQIKLSQSEMNKISLFLSNFTEVSLYNFNIKRYNTSDLIRFGVWHNFINNFQSRIQQYKNGKLFISKSYVEESIKKYFALNFNKHRTVNYYTYNGKGYIFDGAVGDPVMYAKAIKVFNICNNQLEVIGTYYNVDNPATTAEGSIQAVIKRYKYGGKNTYCLISISATSLNAKYKIK